MTKEQEDHDYLMSSVYMALVMNKMNSEALGGTIKEIQAEEGQNIDLPTICIKVDEYTEQVIETLSKKYCDVFEKHGVIDKIEALIETCLEKDGFKD